MESNSHPELFQSAPAFVSTTYTSSKILTMFGNTYRPGLELKCRVSYGFAKLSPHRTPVASVWFALQLAPEVSKRAVTAVVSVIGWFPQSQSLNPFQQRHFLPIFLFLLRNCVYWFNAIRSTGTSTGIPRVCTASLVVIKFAYFMNISLFHIKIRWARNAVRIFN